jgi:signal peptidase I
MTSQNVQNFILQNDEEDKALKKFLIIRDWILFFVFIGLLILFFQVTLIKANVIGVSMQPTLSDGDLILAWKDFDLKRGDIILFPSTENDRYYIKRLIGMSGDQIEISNGIVSVNGKYLQEEYLSENNFNNVNGSWSLGAGEIFVLGDNRDFSQDSRDFGVFQESDVIGELWLKFWNVYTIQNMFR